MIIPNRYFQYCTLSIILQQMALALSTYFIAKAGGALFQVHAEYLKPFIILFFVFALSAYLIGSVIEYWHTKLKNDLFARYVDSIFAKINGDQRFSSTKNQERTMAWLSAEAPSSFAEIADFIIGLLSMYCNVLFTFLVFGMTLGLTISSVMAISLCVSLLLVQLLKNRIAQLANDMQENKLKMVASLQNTWAHHLFSNSALIKIANSDLHDKSKKYFIKTEQYILIEQIVACLPVYIAMPLVLITALGIIDLQSAAIGAFVAVLPRTLQLFGNVHSLSLLNSRFCLIKQKWDNLKNFIDTLEQQNFSTQIDSEKIEISHLSNENTWSTDNFLQALIQKKLKNGRFLIRGQNGSGKSSFLRLIKSYENEALFISSNAILNRNETALSSGESQKKQIKHALSQKTYLLLLDEWDANLDADNISDLNEEIDKIAKNKMVIEVRHKVAKN